MFILGLLIISMYYFSRCTVRFTLIYLRMCSQRTDVCHSNDSPAFSHLIVIKYLAKSVSVQASSSPGFSSLLFSSLLFSSLLFSSLCIFVFFPPLPVFTLFYHFSFISPFLQVCVFFSLSFLVSTPVSLIHLFLSILFCLLLLFSALSSQFVFSSSFSFLPFSYSTFFCVLHLFSFI